MDHRRSTTLLIFLPFGILLLLLLLVAMFGGGLLSHVGPPAGPPPPEDDPDPIPPPLDDMADDVAEESRSPDEGEAAHPSKAHPGFFPKLGGSVVDVDTREPLPGARVVYATSSGDWWGVSTDAEGRFEFEPGSAHDPGGKSYEIRVVAAGYVTWRGSPASPEMSIELVRERQPPRPGRIVGRALGSQGEPLTGVLDIILLDEVFVSAHQCALADENGSFVLEGISPGPRQVFLEWAGRRENVFVPAGGEASVELVSSQLSAGGPTALWTEEQEFAWVLAYERVNKLAIRLSRERDEARRETLEAEYSEVSGRIEAFKRARDAARSARPVIVSGPKGESPSFVTAIRWGRRWVMEVRNGLVEFPALNDGTWKMTFVGPDGEQTKWRLEVPAGEGRFEATFPGR